MKIGKMECDEFFCLLKKEFGLDKKYTYKEACRIYNISYSHLQYHIRKGNITPVSCKCEITKRIYKCELDLLLNTSQLKFKKAKII